MTAAHVITRRERLMLWAGVAGPAAAWAIHLVAGYGYVEAACATGTGVDLVEPVIIALTAVLGAALVACVAGALLVHRAVRRGEIADPRGRLRFLSLAAPVASIVFAAAILMQGAPIIAFDPCSLS